MQKTRSQNNTTEYRRIAGPAPVFFLYAKEWMDFIKNLIADATRLTNEDSSMTPSLGPTVTTDVMDLFNSVEKQGGFYGSADANIATISGKIGDHATLYLALYSDWADTQKGLGQFTNVTRDHMRRAYDVVVNRVVLTAIHELLHFNYHDVVLATAVAKRNRDADVEFDYNHTREASNYWNEELKKQCGPK